MKKFPLILQRDAVQCGVSCLQMICKYYGQSYSFEELENWFKGLVIHPDADPYAVHKYLAGTKK